MGWRGRGGFGPWPGRGPFSYLPPWQRPGWLFGPGACWWLFGAPFWYGGWPFGGYGSLPYAPYGPYRSYPSTYPPTYPWDYPRATFRPQAMPSVEDEIAALEDSKKFIEEELKGIEARIEELKKSSKK